MKSLTSTSCRWSGVRKFFMHKSEHGFTFVTDKKLDLGQVHLFGFISRLSDCHCFVTVVAG